MSHPLPPMAEQSKGIEVCPVAARFRIAGYEAHHQDAEARDLNGECQRKCTTCERWVWPDQAAACVSYAPAPGPTIYVASRTRHAPHWREMRAAGWPIISSWIDESEPGQSGDPADLWCRVVDEIKASAGVVLLAMPDDVLTGALVEVGIALGAGLPVVIVGTAPQVHKHCGFKSHPLVSCATTCVAAFGRILDGAPAHG